MLQVKINGKDHNMLRNAAEQFGNKSEEDISNGKEVCKIAFCWSRAIELIAILGMGLVISIARAFYKEGPTLMRHIWR